MINEMDSLASTLRPIRTIASSTLPMGTYREALGNAGNGGKMFAWSVPFALSAWVMIVAVGFIVMGEGRLLVRASEEAIDRTILTIGIFQLWLEPTLNKRCRVFGGASDTKMGRVFYSM
jgi:hypothetical protein